MYGNEELLRQLDELRAMFAQKRLFKMKTLSSNSISPLLSLGKSIVLR